MSREMRAKRGTNNAARYAIGALSARAAMMLACFRGKLSDRLAKCTTYRGSMMAVGLSEDEVAPYLQSLKAEIPTADVVVGCINSPRSITLSGEGSQIAALRTTLQKDGAFARILKVPVAYHSHQMSAIASEYESLIKGIDEGDHHSNRAVMISSVTGMKVLKETLRNPQYWVSNLVSPVRFSEALSHAITRSQGDVQLSSEIDTMHSILEIGPHSTLQGPVREILQKAAPDAGITYHSTLSRNQPSIPCILGALGELFCKGHVVNISEVNRNYHNAKSQPSAILGLPRYPFDHSNKYWAESRVSKNFRFRPHPPHDLLGVPVPDWNPMEPRWRNMLRIERLPFIEDHKINDSIVYPAAAMIAAALEGARQLVDGREIRAYEVREAAFINALVFPNISTEIEVELRFRQVVQKDSAQVDKSTYEFRLYSYQNETWTHHCQGIVCALYRTDRKSYFTQKDPVQAALQQAVEVFSGMETSQARKLEKSALYEQLLRRFGYQYGATFQGLHSVFSDGQSKATARILPLSEQDKDRARIRQPHIIHPAILDAVLQLALVAAAKGGNNPIPTIVPQRVQRLWVSTAGLRFLDDDNICVIAESAMRSRRKMEASASAFCPGSNELLVEIDGFEGTSVSKVATNASMPEEAVGHLCFRMEWHPDVDCMSREQIMAHCWSSITPETQEKDLIDFEREVTVLIFHSLIQAQQRLASEPITFTRPYFDKYVRWMKSQIQAFESGQYPEVRARYLSLEKNPNEMSRVRRLADTNGMWRFYGAVADNLFNMLSGKLDPLQLLFGDDYATDFYNESNRYSRCGHALANYLELLAHKNPGMRVLEVGAGTGSTTRMALQALKTQEDEELPESARLCRCSRYDFTDISPSLVGAAQEEFGPAHPRMGFSRLDVEWNPGDQGFELGSYDVIIAASVLHATADISETLRNVRALLRPGGKLLLFENVRPDHVRMGSAFGLLPGWWLGVEDSRQNSPCLSEDRWNVALRSNGFSGVDVEFRDFASEECHETSVIVSTAVDRSLVHDLARNGTSWPLIIANVHDATEMALAERVRLSLQTNLGLPCIMGSLEVTAASPAHAGRDCILLSIKHASKSLMEAEGSFLAVRSLVKSCSSILWVTDGGGKQPLSPDHGIVQGLSRTVRREKNDLRFTTLALESPEVRFYQHADMVIQVYRQMAEAKDVTSYEPEFVEINGVLHTNRILEAPNLNASVSRSMSGYDNRPRKFGHSVPLRLSTGSDTGLHSLRFEDDTDVALPLEEDEIEIQVKAVGCNFMDGLSALGRVDVDFIGLEVTGTVSKTGSRACALQVGDEVIAFSLDAYRTYVRTKACLAMPLPPSLSFVQGASIPINFATAYRALFGIARLQRGESVLIHSAAGGTGQAALQLAGHAGAKVFATVGSDQKKQFLVDYYGLQADHIFSSRDNSFVGAIRKATAEIGVDVMLNSLSGELLHASWECIAPYGRFVEIGKNDIRQRSRIDMAPFARNTTFASVDLAAMIRQCPETAGRLLHNVADMVVKEHVRTLETTTYSVNRIEDALRFLLSGRSQGKVVIKVEEGAIVQVCVAGM